MPVHSESPATVVGKRVTNWRLQRRDYRFQPFESESQRVGVYVQTIGVRFHAPATLLHDEVTRTMPRSTRAAPALERMRTPQQDRRWKGVFRKRAMREE